MHFKFFMSCPPWMWKQTSAFVVKQDNSSAVWPSWPETKRRVNVPVNASSRGCGRGCSGWENIDVCSPVCTGEYKVTVKMGTGLTDELPSLTF